MCIFKNIIIDFIFNYFMFLSIGLGSCIYCIWYIRHDTLSLQAREILPGIASAFLIGGAFTACVKSIQFMGIFRDTIKAQLQDQNFLDDRENCIKSTLSLTLPTHIDSLTDQLCLIIKDSNDKILQCISDALYSEALLSKRNDITELWKNISKIIHCERFPEIRDELDRIIFNNYFPKESPCYYIDENLHFNMSFIDGNHDYVTLIEESSFTVVAVNTDPFKHSVSGSILLKNNHDEFSSFVVTDFFIDNVSHLEHVITTKPYILNGHLHYRFEITFKGKERYFVKRRTKKILSLDADKSKGYTVK